jgi:hypothetical protein
MTNTTTPAETETLEPAPTTAVTAAETSPPPADPRAPTPTAGSASAVPTRRRGLWPVITAAVAVVALLLGGVGGFALGHLLDGGRPGFTQQGGPGGGTGGPSGDRPAPPEGGSPQN